MAADTKSTDLGGVFGNIVYSCYHLGLETLWRCLIWLCLLGKPFPNISILTVKRGPQGDVYSVHTTLEEGCRSMKMLAVRSPPDSNGNPVRARFKSLARLQNTCQAPHWYPARRCVAFFLADLQMSTLGWMTQSKAWKSRSFIITETRMPRSKRFRNEMCRLEVEAITLAYKKSMKEQRDVRLLSQGLEDTQLRPDTVPWR